MYIKELKDFVATATLLGFFFISFWRWSEHNTYFAWALPHACSGAEIVSIVFRLKSVRQRESAMRTLDESPKGSIARSIPTYLQITQPSSSIPLHLCTNRGGKVLIEGTFFVYFWMEPKHWSQIQLFYEKFHPILTNTVYKLKEKQDQNQKFITIKITHLTWRPMIPSSSEPKIDTYNRKCVNKRSIKNFMRHFPLVSSVHTPSSVRWKRRLGLLEQYTCVQGGGALSTV